MAKGYKILIRIFGSIILYFISLLFIVNPFQSYLLPHFLNLFEKNLCVMCPFQYTQSSFSPIEGAPTSCYCFGIILTLVGWIIIPGLIIFLFNKFLFNKKK